MDDWKKSIEKFNAWTSNYIYFLPLFERLKKILSFRTL